MPLTTDTLRVTGAITHVNSFSPKIASTQLLQRDTQEYVLDLTSFRVWNAFATVLPGTPLTDDLGLVGGTFGTNAPSVQMEDCKSATKTSYARFLVGLPPEYVAGQTVQMRFAAGMLTTVAGTSCTLDLEAYLSDEDNTVSADLCATAATTMNSLVFADVDFTITSAALSPGDMLDMRITVACVDAASGTAVTPCIAAAKLLCDIQG